ncbi:putative calcium/calmodulin-dependent protein kinase [Podospora australis]|uniref:Calcium/calmodulin-dependent protein kinase n=1 Tax=Podospora australis TaxID=1536484 RepID=A0AAN6WY47_9PEZI|nr:putative calcium/calmodulin-dependent protein kinase [Podospora australis]
MADQENIAPPLRASTYTLPLRPRPDYEKEPMTDASNPAAVPRGLASPDISIEFHGDQALNDTGKPQLIHPRSAPPDVQHFQSPMRHHKRTPSAHREIKETLNARSEYTSDDPDGRSHFMINQYVIKDEIGRGSYGAVHLATDQYGNEYAVKAFSKARLRKRIQSNILRLGPRNLDRGFPSRAGFGAPDLPNARLSDQRAKEAQDALFLIREEIAIMKKLNHPNLVQLIEVLDDPEEDTLYMVLEMCKKGVVMKVGLGESATPYPEEQCRHWFRDLILGIEYLHSQGVVHRDIKPDNLLLTDDDVLKIVDFGVSEMFEKAEDMRTAKSAGSPAFLPPELCIAKHGDVSGKAADIWSIGVSLYCLRYGRVPFEKYGVLDMYEAIRTETPHLPEDENPKFVDVMRKLLEKDPAKRITMAELRDHPWVTKDGKDPLLSAEENCSDPVDDPNPLEVNHAFTRRMSHLVCVMKAIRKFKSLLAAKRERQHPRDFRLPRAPGDNDSDSTPVVSPKTTPKPDDTADFAASILRERQQFFSKGGKAALGLGITERLHQHQSHKHFSSTSTGSDSSSSHKPLLLGIGTGGLNTFSSSHDEHHDPDGIVSDSPTAVDFSVYDRAFDDEVARIKRSNSKSAGGRGKQGSGAIYNTKLIDRSRNNSQNENSPWGLFAAAARGGGGGFADLVKAAMADAKSREGVASPAAEGEAVEGGQEKKGKVEEQS